MNEEGRLDGLKTLIRLLRFKPIVIGDGCWIAAGAFIGPAAVVPAGTRVKAYEVWKCL